jgi:hypothetical protein
MRHLDHLRLHRGKHLFFDLSVTAEIIHATHNTNFFSAAHLHMSQVVVQVSYNGSEYGVVVPAKGEFLLQVKKSIIGNLKEGYGSTFQDALWGNLKLYHDQAATLEITGIHTKIPENQESLYATLLKVSDIESRSLDEVGNVDRRNRFKRLNPILEEIARKKARKGSHEEFDFLGTAYSAVQWNDIEEVYAPSRIFYHQPKISLDDEKLVIVYKYMELASKCFGDITTGKEAKRLHFIAPILVLVCSHFDDVEILVEHDVNGIHIKTKGHFEFVLKRGNKKVCIIEAKKDNLEQGMAQNLLGCEAIADIEDLDCALGIVTNYKEWIFLRNYSNKICIDNSSGIHACTKNSIKTIGGKICAFFSSKFQ